MKNRHGRATAAIAVLVAAVMLLAACGSSSSSANESSGGTATGGNERLKLTVALPWPGAAPLCCIAEEAPAKLGYFDKLGLDVTYEYGTGSTAPMQTLVAGRADLAAGVYANAGLGAYAAGSNDIRFIGGSFNQNYERSSEDFGLLFGAAEGISSPADLKGKTVGIVSGTNPADPTYVMVSKQLAAAGLSDDDVDWAVIGAPNLRAQALIAGRIDFTNLSVELVDQVKTGGKDVLTLQPPAGSWQGWAGCSCWFTTTKVLENPSKREAVERYIQGVTELMRDMSADRDLFVKAAAEFQPDFAQATPESQEFAWKWIREQWRPNGGMNFDDMTAWFEQSYLPANPDSKGKVTLDAIVDSGPVVAVMDRIGTVDAKVDPLQPKE